METGLFKDFKLAHFVVSFTTAIMEQNISYCYFTLSRWNLTVKTEIASFSTLWRYKTRQFSEAIEIMVCRNRQTVAVNLITSIFTSTELHISIFEELPVQIYICTVLKQNLTLTTCIYILSVILHHLNVHSITSFRPNWYVYKVDIMFTARVLSYR